MMQQSRSTKVMVAAAAMLVMLVSLVSLAVLVAQQRPAASAQSPQLAASSPDALLGQALHQEEIEGRLTDAIGTYSKVLKAPGVTKAQAARAQFRIGACYERLGVDGARKAYEAVVANYGDQTEFATQARARLAALVPGGGGAVSIEPSVRRLFTDPSFDAWEISPDGRFVLGVDNTKSDVIVIRTLATGETRRIATGSGDVEPHWSPDGTQIGYLLWEKDKPESIHVLNVKTGVSRKLYSSAVLTLGSWSPDGRVLAVMVVRGERRGRGLPEDLILINVADGSTEAVASFSDGTTMPRFSPDGRFLMFSRRQSGDVVGYDIVVYDLQTRAGTMLVNDPANDRPIDWTPDGHAILFRSDRGGADGLWTLAVKEGRRAGDPIRIKGAIPPLIPLSLSRTGSLLFRVATKTFRPIFVAEIDLKSGKTLLPPRQISEERFNINDAPRWSRDGSRLAFMSAAADLNQMNMLSVWSMADGKTRRVSLEVPAGSVTAIEWSKDDQSVIYRSFDADARVGLYRVDVGSGVSMPIVPGRVSVPGDRSRELATWAPDGGVLYEYIVSSGMRTGIRARTVSTGVTKDLAIDTPPLAVNAWSSAVSQDGRWIALAARATGGASSIVLVPAEGGSPTQVCRAKNTPFNSFSWSAAGTGILYAADRFGLGYCAIQTGEVLSIDVGLGAIRSASLHPDGRHVALTTMAFDRDEGVWMLENFLPPAQTKATPPKKK